jgi:hypothetical protein
MQPLKMNPTQIRTPGLIKVTDTRLLLLCPCARGTPVARNFFLPTHFRDGSVSWPPHFHMLRQFTTSFGIMPEITQCTTCCGAMTFLLDTWPTYQSGVATVPVVNSGFNTGFCQWGYRDGKKRGGSRVDGAQSTVKP